MQKKHFALFPISCSSLGRAFVRHPASASSLYNWGEALLGSVIHCTAQCRFKPSLHGITWQNIKKINDGMLLPVFTDQVWIHNAGSWILTKLQGRRKSEAAEKCRRSSQHKTYRKLCGVFDFCITCLFWITSLCLLCSAVYFETFLRPFIAPPPTTPPLFQPSLPLSGWPSPGFISAPSSVCLPSFRWLIFSYNLLVILGGAPCMRVNEDAAWVNKHKYKQRRPSTRASPNEPTDTSSACERTLSAPDACVEPR